MALSPFEVRREPFHDVLSIYIRLVGQSERRKPESERIPEGSFVIGDTLYKPAQNDDWW